MAPMNKENHTDIEIQGLTFPKRKVWIKTFGCQMNYHDSERLLSHLRKLNYEETQDKEEAQLLLFNTCAVRELANLKFYSNLGEVKRSKEKNDVIIGVGGCVSQTEGEDLIKKYRHLDFAFGTDVIDQINDFVIRAYKERTQFSHTPWDRSKNYSIETKITHGSPVAFVNIIKGCNKCCSYCIVPFTIGREISRRKDEIVKDVRNLVDTKGIQEIMLLGQNVNSFGKENGETLSELLFELDQIEGLELIRYTTSHPYDVSDELIKAHGQCKKLSNHLHLPVQSGSNTVLKRMLREYTAEHYLGLLDKLRQSNPNLVVTTDIICGFPNETEVEHQETLALLKTARFDFIYGYHFSKRMKTRASRMDDFLTNDLRKKRLYEVQDLQLNIQNEIRQQMIGKVYRVLVDGSNIKDGKLKWKGRTNCNRIVHFEPILSNGEKIESNLKWHWVDLLIRESTALSSQGQLLIDYGNKIHRH
jgi:tRNA-2-methylthio-N6-dimethylallyladenosine synthase